ncbi:uncharacterized protein LOC133196873 [Saccostrea echinata]|uniref:uncharacterized protein LOC133196873 n=1 Tax=Saccostrea echinata TaxID=191078 RepID=UPI002A83CB50|nr:uncharacterized protein LOC133196873 [Saccostrea echinata]
MNRKNTQDHIETELTLKSLKRLKRNHSTIPFSKRISPPFLLSRQNRPFWSSQQSGKVRHLLQFLQGNFPRNLHIVRNQEFTVQRKLSPDHSNGIQSTTTPTVSATAKAPFIKLPTTLIPLFALTATAPTRKAFQTEKGLLQTIQTKTNILSTKRPSMSGGVNNKVQSNNNRIRNMDIHSQHVDTSLVSPSGSLILRVLNNFLVLQKNILPADEIATIVPPSTSTVENITFTSAVTTSSEKLSIIANKFTTSTMNPTTVKPKTLVTNDKIHKPQHYVNVVRSVGEAFCKICEKIGHQFTNLCRKQNCLLPSSSSSS